MAIADTTDIIADWPLEGVSFRKIWDRAPAANEFFAARAKAEDYSRRPEERQYWKHVCADALARCGQWINACVENRLLVLKVRPPDKPWEEPVSLSASVALNLSAGESGEFLRGPNGEIFYDPIYYAAATLPPEPPPTPLRTEIVGTVVVRPETPLSTRRKVAPKNRGDAVTKCTDYIVSVLEASPERKTMTNEVLEAECRKRFNVSHQDYIKARSAAFARVPRAEAAWRKAGRTRGG
jgi:hypothetical protein